MRNSLLLSAMVFSLAGVGCDSSSDPDPGDAGFTDSGRTDATIADGGRADANAPSDAGLPPDGGPSADSGTPNDGGTPTDGGVPTDAGGSSDGSVRFPCNDPYSIDGFVTGGIGANPRTLLPGTANPSSFTRIEEASTFIAGDFAAVTVADGLDWHAQISHLTMFDQIRYDQMVVDPEDGAVYVGIEQKIHSDTTAMRFYNADGSLATELTRGGEPGLDIEGGNGQSNFFVVKYGANGAVQWVSRFGPNSPSTTRAGLLPAIGLVSGGVRVVGYTSGSTQIVIADGKANSLTYQAAGAHVFWATLDQADGGYVTGSIRRIDVDRAGSDSTVSALGFSAHNALGQTAVGGRLGRDAASPTFTIGAGGTGEVVLTSTQTRTYFLRIEDDGSPGLVETVAGPNAVAIPEARAVGVGPGGELVAGAQFSVLAGDATFFTPSGSQVVSYAAQHSFLVAYEPTGDIRWLKMLPNTHRNAVSRILVTSDAVYLMGTGAAGVVMGTGESNQTALPLSGYVLSKHSLATGDLQWLRMLTDETGVSGIGGFDVWSNAGNLVIPMSFNTFRLAGPGIDRIYESLTPGVGLLGALVLSPDGAPVACQPIAEGGGTFRPR